MFKRIWAEARMAAMKAAYHIGNVVGKISTTVGNWFHKQKESLAVSLHAESRLAKKPLGERITQALNDVLPKKTKKSLNHAFKARVISKHIGRKEKLGFEHLSNKQVARKWINSYRSQWVYAKQGMLAMLAFGLINSDIYGSAKKADASLQESFIKSISPIEKDIEVAKYSKKTVEEVTEAVEDVAVAVESVIEAVQAVEKEEATVKPPISKAAKKKQERMAKLKAAEAAEKGKDPAVEEVQVEEA